MIVINEKIAHYGHNPTCKIDIVYEFFLIVQHFQRSILQQIQSVIPVCC